MSALDHDLVRASLKHVIKNSFNEGLQGPVVCFHKDESPFWSIFESVLKEEGFDTIFVSLRPSVVSRILCTPPPLLRGTCLQT